MKRFLWIVVIVVVLLTGMRIANRSKGESIVNEERIIPVVALAPTVGVIEDKVKLTGDIKADTEVGVRPAIPGRVAEIYVDEGSFVNKGDKMLSYVEGIKPEDELYNDMVVKAPITGIVGMKMTKIGEQLTSGQGGISPVFTIYKIDEVRVVSNIPEKYYSAVSNGTKAEIVLDAYPKEVFYGNVSTIRPIIDPMTRTAQIEINIPNAGYKIKPGMFASVDIVLKRKSKATIIPYDAVLGDIERYVFVAKDGVAVKKNVSLGILQDNKVEIESGLISSDRVITLGQRVVKEGSKIEVKAND